MISVVIATYNRRDILRFTLQSVLNQDFEDFEVLVVGDHCTDGTAEIVEGLNDPRLRFINLPKRIGTQSGPNNEGLAQAKGKYIAYLGHDDLWFPWHLSILAKTLDDGVDFSFSLTSWIHKNGSYSIRGVPSKKGELKFHHAAPSSWMHRKEVIDRSGSWRTDTQNLVTLVDNDLFQRIVKTGINIQPTRELSVIKFPSPEWQTYSLTEYPQENYIDQLLKEPRELQIDLLTKYAIQSMENPPQKAGIPYRAMWKMIHLYGRDRWPVTSFLKIASRYDLHRRKKLRGLTQSPVHPIKKELPF